jgi:hypothetical protein
MPVMVASLPVGRLTDRGTVWLLLRGMPQTLWMASPFLDPEPPGVPAWALQGLNLHYFPLFAGASTSCAKCPACLSALSQAASILPELHPRKRSPPCVSLPRCSAELPDGHW